jgi:hypothetical protein
VRVPNPSAWRFSLVAFLPPPTAGGRDLPLYGPETAYTSTSHTPRPSCLFLSYHRIRDPLL